MSGMTPPFRGDARYERVVACAPPEVVLMVARSYRTRHLRLAAFFVAMALGSALVRWQLADDRLFGVSALVNGAMVFFALWLVGASSKSTTLSDAQREALPRRCGFSAQGLCIEGPTGYSAWPNTSLERLVRHGPWLAIELAGAQMVVVDAEASAAVPVDAFLAPRITRAPDDARGRRFGWVIAGYFAVMTLGALAARWHAH